MRLAREKHVDVRVSPTGIAINESVDLAYELYDCVFRRIPRELIKKRGCAGEDTEARN